MKQYNLLQLEIKRMLELEEKLLQLPLVYS